MEGLNIAMLRKEKILCIQEELGLVNLPGSGLLFGVHCLGLSLYNSL